MKEKSYHTEENANEAKGTQRKLIRKREDEDTELCRFAMRSVAEYFIPIFCREMGLLILVKMKKKKEIGREWIL